MTRLKVGNVLSQDDPVLQLIAGTNITLTAAESSGDAQVTIAASGGAGSAKWAAGDKVVYVTKSGNDSNDGLSPATSFLTVTAAIAAVGRGRVEVGAGIFVERVDLTGLYGIHINAVFANDTSAGTVIQAPSAGSAAMYLSSNGGGHVIENLSLKGSGATYTGNVLDYAGGQGNCVFRNIRISGNVSDAVCQAGTYGGVGLHVKNTEDNLFENIQLDHCNLGLWVDSNFPGGTNSQNVFDGIFFNPCYQLFKEFASTPGSYCTGANTYSNWKTSGAYIDSTVGYAVEMQGSGHTCNQISLVELADGFAPSPSGKVSWLINSCNSSFLNCSNAGGTLTKVTGADNHFENWIVQEVFTVDSTASRNHFVNPTGSGQNTPPADNFVNNGIDTRFTQLQPYANPAFTDNGKRTKQGMGATPPSASGRWYPAPLAPQSSVVLVANRMYLVPIQAPEVGKGFAAMAVHVTTGAAANVITGVYFADIDNLPGVFAFARGDPTSVASTGDITMTDARGTSSLGLNGILWLAVASNGTPTFLGAAAGTAPTPYVGDATLATVTGGGCQGYYVDSAYSGAFPYFPATVTPGSLHACGAVPTVFYKYA